MSVGSHRSSVSVETERGKKQKPAYKHNMLPVLLFLSSDSLQETSLNLRELTAETQ